MSIIRSTVVGVRAEPTRKLSNASPTITCRRSDRLTTLTRLVGVVTLFTNPPR